MERLSYCPGIVIIFKNITIPIDKSIKIVYNVITIKEVNQDVKYRISNRQENRNKVCF